MPVQDVKATSRQLMLAAGIARPLRFSYRILAYEKGPPPIAP